MCVCVCVVQASSTQCTELKLLHVPFNIRNTLGLHEYSSGFIHSPVDGHLGPFHVWAMRKATVNILM